MQIILIQAEIEAAIEAAVRDRVTIDEGQTVVIDLNATRGPEGFKAVIDITNEPLLAGASTIVLSQLDKDSSELVKDPEAPEATAEPEATAPRRGRPRKQPEATPISEPNAEPVASVEEILNKAEKAEAAAEEATPPEPADGHVELVSGEEALHPEDDGAPIGSQPVAEPSPEPEPAPKKPSLFGNLKKVTNTPTT